MSENVDDKYRRLARTELTYMSRSDVIFVVLANELRKRGKQQLFKAKHIAERIEQAFLRRDDFMARCGKGPL